MQVSEPDDACRSDFWMHKLKLAFQTWRVCLVSKESEASDPIKPAKFSASIHRPAQTVNMLPGAVTENLNGENDSLANLRSSPLALAG